MSDNREPTWDEVNNHLTKILVYGMERDQDAMFVNALIARSLHSIARDMSELRSNATRMHLDTSSMEDC